MQELYFMFCITDFKFWDNVCTVISEKQMAPYKRTAEEVSLEWQNHRILLTDSKARTKQHVSIIDSGREKIPTF